ncbi:C5a anaphylatoxin chemotactic receptor 1-like [Protopterus annectens]|uniref:C5a anaphylatoxin chemotactic receptor 1-like n=1 Tax=Protopterus annectens TaxID=7888 RepID=UPI001CFA496D|nr:C5a anaphylatoxin chemotactic receptor 1-like [Protopterus annectens]
MANVTQGYNEESDDYDISVDYDYNPGVHSHLSTLRITTITAYSLVFLVGILGNTLVIWITGFELKKTVNIIWFLNLSVADFLCCMSLPFLITQFALDYRWPFGSFLCKIIPATKILNMFASVFLLMVVSIDRCVLVLRPVWCQNTRTTSMAAIVCFAVWLLALILAVPFAVFQNASTDTLSEKTTCGIKNQSAILGLRISWFVFGFVLPFFIITASYSLLMLKVKNIQYSGCNKTYKMLCAVIISFFICWSPYHVIGLLGATNGNMHSSPIFIVLSNLTQSLAYVNSCVNPIIYVIVGQNFKTKLRKSVRTALKNVFTDEMTQSSVYTRSKSKSLTEERMQTV